VAAWSCRSVSNYSYLVRQSLEITELGENIDAPKRDFGRNTG
jgi:hypothetical protein